ncbi:MAG: hypothetical protein AABY22_05175 [Nanoarchaeota archaeon]
MLDLFEESKMDTQVKPRCRLVGTDGNVFCLAGRVGAALRKAGQPERAREFFSALMTCKSYEEARHGQ